MTRLILDLATCALDGAESWLPAVKAKSNLVDPDKIAKDLAEKRAGQIETMALDPDLCRISAVGACDVTGWTHGPIEVMVLETEPAEREYLARLRETLDEVETVTFNGLAFDLPVLQRRLLYLGLRPLDWKLDRFRTNHVDLLERLSAGDRERRKSLNFYVRRLGWTDLNKPLSGADEALAPSRGQWLELAESVRRDVEAARRLAVWARVLTPSAGEPV